MVQDAISPLPAPTPPQPWPTVWLQVLTRPSVATFEKLAGSPNASAARAVLWTFLSALVGYGGAGLLQLAARNWSYLLALEKDHLGGALATSFSMLFCGPPPVAAFMIFRLASVTDQTQTLPGLGLTLPVAVAAVIGLLLSATVTHALARTLGGTGTYTQLLYAFAAYLAPLTLVMSMVSVLPVVNYLAVPLALYGLALNMLAIKAVHRFGWSETVASSGLIFFVGVIAVAAAGAAVLIGVSIAADDIYQNITYCV